MAKGKNSDPQLDLETLANRVCTKCLVTKPLSSYTPIRSKPGKYNTRCKACRAEYNRNWRKTSPKHAVWYERHKIKDRARVRTWSYERRLWEQYHITMNQYHELLASQNGCCAICGTDTPGRGKQHWHVDHDHACCPETKSSCGQCVRGLLCSRCNPMLGLALDNLDTLRAAIKYIEGASGG